MKTIMKTMMKIISTVLLCIIIYAFGFLLGKNLMLLFLSFI